MHFRGIVVLFLFLTINATSCAPTRESVVQPPTQKPAKVALVLGAGAARGFAHIGVLKVLESNGIPVSMIVGTSAGSFVGSLYSYGFNAWQLQKMAIDLQKSDIADIGLPDNGFIKGELLEAYINRVTRNTPIEKLRIPFYAVATNIQNGQEVIFGSGNTGMAVRASCAIPGVFRPVRIGSQMFVDGGVVSPVAVDAARKMGADIVIAVDIASDIDATIPEGTMDTILQSINIMYAKMSAIQLSRADIIIRPKVGRIGSADFDKRHEAILEGEKAAQESLPVIREIMSRQR
ncbi:MAG: patatin-like phospholipase family protein [Nitrospirae bacterium]|nr:patatin-like phospholipase family protein [Nitrospirota bacterium]